MTDTTEQSRRWAARLAPSRIAALAVLASIPVKLLSEKLSDPDLWWHLKTGSLIAAQRAIPRRDPFSYTARNEPWVVQEWGSEVILNALRSAFGLYGILAFRALALLLLYVLVSRLMVRRMGTGLGTWALLALAAYAGSMNWTERPNLLSFLLFVVTLDLIDRRSRSLWLFVPIAAVWANLHGMVILGIGLLLVVAAAEGLKLALRWEGADRAWAGRLGLVAVAGFAASLLNPFGIGLHLHALRLVRLVSGFVSEWATPDFHTIGPMIFLALLLLTVVALALSPEKKDPTDVALALAFTVLGLQAVRNLTPSAIVLGLVCARYLPGALAAIPRRPAQRADVTGGTPLLLGGLGVLLTVVGLGIVLAAGFPRDDAPESIIDESYPLAAIDALDEPGVRAFVHDAWAPLVIERSWPNAHVFVDLRWDFYGATIARNYRRAITAAPEWRAILDESCTTHVLIRPREPLAQVLRLADEWELVRTDTLDGEAVAVTFTRREKPARCRNLIQLV